jgi:peroxiredoxin
MAKTYSDSPMQLGEQAPNFMLPSSTGALFKLYDQKARGFLVMFVCNHCPYVIPKWPLLKKLQLEFQEVMFLGIHSNDPAHEMSDAWEHSLVLHKTQGLPFVFLHDESQEVAEAYGAVCTPDLFLLDEHFKLFYHGRLDADHRMPSAGQDMRLALNALIEGKGPPLSEPSLGCSIKWKPEHYERLHPL